MTARDRLLELRRSLVVTIVTRTFLVGVAVALAVFAIANVFEMPALVVGLLVLGSLATFALRAWMRASALRSLPRIALWVEERTPQLRYSLVTIADGVDSPILENQALSASWWMDARRTMLRSLIVPAFAAVSVAVLAYVLPAYWPVVVGGHVSGSASNRAGAAHNADVLAVVHVAVTPPSYSGRAASMQDDPTSIEALVGSSIAVSGNGDARVLTATADSATRSVAQRGDRWSLSLTMPARPSIVRLHSSAGRDKLIVLAPTIDAPPAVTLLIPAHDTIVRKATGSLALHAQLRDDIGLHDGEFELVISSGSGENFTFRTARIGHTALGNVLERTLDSRVSLDSLALQPGDLVQLRAVARDGNTVSGPGVGSSETRVIRVARADEYDSVAVDAAPPPDAEEQVLSQRMLIILTEKLEKTRASIAHPQLVTESRRIANDQAKLRKRVGDIVFQRMGDTPLSEEESGNVATRGKLTAEDILKLADSVTNNAGNVMDVEGDETPILAINKPLLEAFNAMWDAGRALEVGEPGKALPPMRIALAAIERARQAERIYLRGRPKTEVVDVAKVRLAGKDKGASSIRQPTVAADPVVRRRSETFERVTSMLASNPDAAADSLLVMRVDALTDAPKLAAALDDAAKALRKRDNAAIQLAWMQVRRTLGGAALQHSGVSAWQGAGGTTP